MAGLLWQAWRDSRFAGRAWMTLGMLLTLYGAVRLGMAFT
jgi:antirestriction protein ArdC